MCSAEILRDGSILVSDDMNSLIYRISYLGEPTQNGVQGAPEASSLPPFVAGVSVGISMFALSLCARYFLQHRQHSDAQYAGKTSGYERVDVKP